MPLWPAARPATMPNAKPRWGFACLARWRLRRSGRWIITGLRRVAIVDFDVHHGNGTQDLLWDEARCLFVSSPPDAALSGVWRGAAKLGRMGRS